VVFVETAVAVFSTGGRAEEAVKELLENHVPEKSVMYLTRSESEAKTVGKQFGAVAVGIVGGAACLPASPLLCWPFLASVRCLPCDSAPRHCRG
jgi:hypothetical protein